jgi:hypothetical protein
MNLNHHATDLIMGPVTLIVQLLAVPNHHATASCGTDRAIAMWDQRMATLPHSTRVSEPA